MLGGMKCAVFGCPNKFRITAKNPNNTVSYFTFPKDSEIRWIWMEKCSNSVNPDYARICSDHFTTEDYIRDLRAELLNIKPKKILLKNAVPSVNLPFATPKCVEISDEKLSLVKIVERKKIVDEILKASYSENSVVDSPEESVIMSDPSYHAVNECILPHNIEISDTRSSNDIQQKGECTILQNLNVTSDNRRKLATDNTEKNNKSVLRSNCLLKKKLEKSEKQKSIIAGQLSAVKLRLLNKSNKVRQQSVKISESKCLIQRLKNKVKLLEKLKYKRDSMKEKYFDALRKVFSPCQIKRLLGKKRVNWEKDDITSAFSLFNLSEKAYIYLKEKMNMPFPGKSTLQRYASKIDHGLLEVLPLRNPTEPLAECANLAEIVTDLELA